MSVNASSPWADHSFSLCSSSIITWMAVFQTFIRIIFLLPLFALVLRLAYQRWKRHVSMTTSHSDAFTHHVAAMELLWLLGVVVAYCGVFATCEAAIRAGTFATFIILYGESLFHVLACMEWYLAVVHPVAYRGTRGARGVATRNIVTGCVWLLSFGLMGVSEALPPEYSQIPLLCLLCFSAMVISYCSLNVLRVLIRPGPGTRAGQAGQTERADQSKQRPVTAVAAISAVLWVWLVGFLISIPLLNFKLLHPSVSCTVQATVGLFNIPSSVVSPVLYLQREGRLPCGCRK